MPRFLPVAVGFYVLSTSLGVLLRYFFVSPFAFPVFGNGVHAHSHTLYFGWGALALFTLILLGIGARGRLTRLFLGSIAAIAGASFVSFLEGGYSVPSIVISALSLVVWPIGLVVVWRLLRGHRELAASYFRTAMVYVLLASGGAATRAVFIATDASAYANSLAVFAFLQNFSWFFVFGLMGLLLRAADDLGIPVDRRGFRRFLVLAAPLAWLTFPLGVPQGSEGALGIAARIATILLVVPGTLGARALWRAGRSGSSAYHHAFRWLALWLGLDAILGAFGALGLSELALRSRHLAILYVHIRLVGFFSLGLMLCIFARARLRFGPGLWTHNIGLCLMLGGLALGGAPAFGLDLPPLLPRLALGLAALGGLVTASAGILWLVQLLLAGRRGAEPSPAPAR